MGGEKLVYVDDRIFSPKQHCACLMVRPVSRFDVVAFRARVFEGRYLGTNKLTSTTVFPVQIQTSIKEYPFKQIPTTIDAGSPLPLVAGISGWYVSTIARRAKMVRADYARRRGLFSTKVPRYLGSSSHQKCRRRVKMCAIPNNMVLEGLDGMC